MLRLRPFEVAQPTTLDEVLRLLALHGDRARLIAGGTDLLPNMKLGQTDAHMLISLRRVQAMRGVTLQGDALLIGAGTRLSEIASHRLIASHMPVLAAAAGRVAGPQIRNMGTLGGNLCLDTRCRYINQSQLFRDALGGCLKSHGDECHVVPGGKGCVAALSSDTAPVLIALDATAQIMGSQGARDVPLARIYSTDGLAHTALESGEVLTAVSVPLPNTNLLFITRKWAVRRSIDFPLVAFCLRFQVDPCDPGHLLGGLLVVGVLGPRPRSLSLDRLAGSRVDAALAERVADVAFNKCRPLPNVPGDPDYRRRRLAVEVQRAVLTLVGQDRDDGGTS